jgi:hypothetical protein
VARSNENVLSSAIRNSLSRTAVQGWLRRSSYIRHRIKGGVNVSANHCADERNNALNEFSRKGWPRRFLGDISFNGNSLGCSVGQSGPGKFKRSHSSEKIFPRDFHHPGHFAIYLGGIYVP